MLLNLLENDCLVMYEVLKLDGGLVKILSTTLLNASFFLLM